MLWHHEYAIADGQIACLDRRMLGAGSEVVRPCGGPGAAAREAHAELPDILDCVSDSGMTGESRHTANYSRTGASLARARVGSSWYWRIQVRSIQSFQYQSMRPCAASQPRDATA